MRQPAPDSPTPTDSVFPTVFIRAGFLNTSYHERPRINRHLLLVHRGNVGQGAIGKP
jgi:hypothetical protein